MAVRTRIYKQAEQILLRRIQCYGMCRSVALVRADVSEERVLYSISSQRALVASYS
jgi:hypothetical protein